MTQVQILDASPDRSGGYKVDVGRGQRVGRVSSEWFSRPADERYLSLDALMASVKGRAERSRTRTVESAAVRVEASRNNPERLDLILPGAEQPVTPTHWSFGQLAALVSAPAAYLRQLPAPLAGINLQYGLTNHRAEQVKTLETDDGRMELRAVTGPDYGRIYDHELVAVVQRIAGNGTGDTRWKVPGVLDWPTGIYNPMVDISADTTTLYASDRNVFLFLVDDLNPIEAGKLSSPIPGAIWSMPSSTLPISRTVTGCRCCSPRSSTGFPGCDTCSPMAAMPATSCAKPSAASANGPSRSSSGPMPQRAPWFSRAAGSSNERWHGSAATAVSPRTLNKPSRPPLPGCSSHPSISSPGASQDIQKV